VANNLGAGGQEYFTQAVFNALVPREGPKALAVSVPFASGSGPFTADLTLTQSQGYMSVVQGIYIDNSGNTNDVLNITCSGTGQTIAFPAGGQGYIPLIVAKPSTFTFASEGTANVNAIFLNVPVPAIIWGATTGGGGGGGALSAQFNADLTGYGFGAPLASPGPTTSPLQLDKNGNLAVTVVGYQFGSGFDTPNPLVLDSSNNLMVNIGEAFGTVFVAPSGTAMPATPLPPGVQAVAGGESEQQSLTGDSGVQADATCVATLHNPFEGSLTFLAGFTASFGGATAGSLQTITVTGAFGGTKNYVVAIPTGVTEGGILDIRFDPPLQASAVDTDIVVTMPAAGAGNTAQVVTADGFFL
jgi:hypothetical protein